MFGINERHTENIVREHFKPYEKQGVITIEEQKSSNPRIQKLLQNASKSGGGIGKPEFIITYNDNPDFLIVIECKADIKKHESESKDDYKNYAVDGVLSYASYLSKEFDVLAIAVSGQNVDELKISHYLQVKGSKSPVSKFGNTLLPPQDYEKGYKESEEKYKQDYDNLLLFSQALNRKLHSYRIKTENRALLIACILISQNDTPFVQGYKTHKQAQDLCVDLCLTTERQFKNSGITEQKLKTIQANFNFIKTEPALLEHQGVLRDLITEIYENIGQFRKTREYFDVLSEMYIEFLKYANDNKGLGIVLTPEHITKFMAEIAEVNKDSVVYDNCTGTGGFLISAMALMVQDAKGDSEKMKHIKNEQLFGVEQAQDIFTLACSNMFIHQDGKTNLHLGDCFDRQVMNNIVKQHPTVGLLNPPYKSDKKNDTEELSFVLNNLECLQQGSKCVAILRMQCALSTKGKILELKKKLLQNHTLEAVFSMPDELFFNSEAGVVTCIMVLTAKRQHPKGQKTFFGYFKEDGFVKRKNKGRIDEYKKWEGIKSEWLKAYRNKENIEGISVNREVSAHDEWCAEVYMKTDYSLLSKEYFEKSVRDFIAFKIKNNQYD